MDTAESRLKECKQIAGRLKGELEQKAQHSRTADKGPAAMDTSTPVAPPQVGPKKLNEYVVCKCCVDLYKVLCCSSRPAGSVQWPGPRAWCTKQGV